MFFLSPMSIFVPLQTGFHKQFAALTRDIYDIVQNLVLFAPRMITYTYHAESHAIIVKYFIPDKENNS